MGTRSNRTLWWSLVGALVLYMGMAHVVPLQASPGVPVAVLLGVFVALSVGIALGSLAHRSRALSGPIRRGELDPTSPEGRAKAFPAFIVNLALSESVGIYGLVLAFLSGRAGLAIPFGLAGLALLYLHRPTAPDLVPPLGGGDAARRPPPIA